MYRILAAEDDQIAVSVLNLVLGKNDFDFDIAYDGGEAIEYIKQYPYDVFLIDIMMPEKNGLEVLREMRNQDIYDPVIIVSALHKREDIIRGFKHDTDDYLVKPFHPDELIARIYCQIRRSVGAFSNELEIAKDFTLNIEDRLFCYKNQPINLSPNESKILFLLVKNQSKYIDKGYIMDYLYHGDDEPAIQVIDVQLHNLREKLNGFFEDEDIITNEYGKGFRLTLH